MTENSELKDWTETDYKDAESKKMFSNILIGTWLVIAAIIWISKIPQETYDNWISALLDISYKGLVFVSMSFIAYWLYKYDDPGLYISFNPYRFKKVDQEIEWILRSEGFGFQKKDQNGIIDEKIQYTLENYDLEIVVYKKYSEINLLLLRPRSVKAEPVKEGRLSILRMNKTNWEIAKKIQRMIDTRLKPLKLI